MDKEKDGSSAQIPGFIILILKFLNALSGKGFVRKTGTGLAIWGIISGDWLPFLGGLLVRLVPTLTEHAEKLKQADETEMLESALPHAAVVAKAAHDKKLATIKSASPPPSKTAFVDKCTKPTPKSKRIVHIVEQARLNAKNNDPQPGDITVLEMAEAMGI